jgi:hypothetical protein
MCLAPPSIKAMKNPLAGLTVSEKLTRSNYLLWQSQVLPAIRSNRLMSFIDEKAQPPPETITVQKDGASVKEENPDYEVWVATDQQVLSYLVNTLSPDILVITIGIEMAAEVWGCNQNHVCLSIKDAGLKPSRCPRQDEEGEPDHGAILHQDEGLHQ